MAITDQFLLDIYSILEKTGDIAYFFMRRRRTMWDVAPDCDDPRMKRYFKEFSSEKFRKLIYRLKKNNYIKVRQLKNRDAIMLTSRGIDKAIKSQFKSQKGEKIKRKDKKWIMVIFDIPSKEKNKRAILRSILQNLNYKMFQKSVWITPYDVFEKTTKLLQFYDLEKYIRIFLIEEID